MRYDSMFALMEAFPTEEACILHLEKLPWPKGIVCPLCGSTRKFHRIERRHIYKCADCHKEFSVRKGTIFERLYRTDEARSRVHGGSGLGLAIVKSIVDAHGGEVFVETTPGLGSTFGFRLPPAGQDA